MEHTLVNPNQLCSHVITVQENPFANAPILLSTEAKLIFTDTDEQSNSAWSFYQNINQLRAPDFPHIILSTEHEWDTQIIHFQKSSGTTEEDISRTVGAVNTQGKYFDFVEDLTVIHRTNPCIT